MSVWGIEIKEITPRLREILIGDVREVEAITTKLALFGWGRQPMVLVGFIPFSFLSDKAVMWAVVTTLGLTRGPSFPYDLECAKLTRRYLKMQERRLFAEILPGDKTGMQFARAAGFKRTGEAHGRQVMEFL